MKMKLGPKNCLYPMPTTLIGALVNGKPNYITIAHVGIMDLTSVSLGMNKSHFTNAGIKENKTFSVNIPSTKLIKETDYCGFASMEDTDKFSTIGFTEAKADKVNAPLIKECPLNLECVVKQILPLGTHDLFIAEVVAAHADEDILDGDEISMEKLSLFAYCPIVHEYRAIGDKIGIYGFSTQGN